MIIVLIFGYKMAECTFRSVLAHSITGAPYSVGRDKAPHISLSSSLHSKEHRTKTAENSRCTANYSISEDSGLQYVNIPNQG